MRSGTNREAEPIPFDEIDGDEEPLVERILRKNALEAEEVAGYLPAKSVVFSRDQAHYYVSESPSHNITKVDRKKVVVLPDNWPSRLEPIDVKLINLHLGPAQLSVRQIFEKHNTTAESYEEIDIRISVAMKSLGFRIGDPVQIRLPGEDYETKTDASTTAQSATTGDINKNPTNIMPASVEDTELASLEINGATTGKKSETEILAKPKRRRRGKAAESDERSPSLIVSTRKYVRTLPNHPAGERVVSKAIILSEEWRALTSSDEQARVIEMLYGGKPGEKHLTASEIAEILGIKPVTVYRHDNGFRKKLNTDFQDRRKINRSPIIDNPQELADPQSSLAQFLRDVFRLYIQGLSKRNIARNLGCSRRAIDNALFSLSMPMVRENLGIDVELSNTLSMSD
ncbi:MAG TPA: hypothetical protein VMR41_01025 [Patescibacteria group bacterium]|nr:hypothetical protein [Patescibacteria group bacterium]